MSIFPQLYFSFAALHQESVLYISAFKKQTQYDIHAQENIFACNKIIIYYIIIIT